MIWLYNSLVCSVLLPWESKLHNFIQASLGLFCAHLIFKFKFLIPSFFVRNFEMKIAIAIEKLAKKSMNQHSKTKIMTIQLIKAKIIQISWMNDVFVDIFILQGDVM